MDQGALQAITSRMVIEAVLRMLAARHQEAGYFLGIAIANVIICLTMVIEWEMLEPVLCFWMRCAKQFSGVRFRSARLR
jgi:hypothetical protein